MSLPYKKKLIPYAKRLRRDMTLEEKKIWYRFLSNCPVRFQRQKAIGGFIVDFFCHAAKLVVEIDGMQHYTKAGLKYDAYRTKKLNAFGVKVIRFTNYEVKNEFRSVCRRIKEELRSGSGVELPLPLRGCPPRGGG